jgi:uncharacterized protein YyaL (SSP411 family)
MNPYIQFQGMQDQQGLAPVFQNISQQQANQNAALGEQNQQVMQAGQTQNGAGANQLAMAMALRKNKPMDQNAQDAQMGGLSTYNPLTQYQVSNTYGTDPYSQQSRMLASQEF